MSGTVTSNVFKASGVIAATPGGLDWSSAVITGSTLSAETGRGYFINTTSNACTITLPASPEIGDQIVFADYARTWATNNVIIDSNGNNFQGDPDTYIVDYSTAGQSLNIVYSDATKGWLPVSDDAVADVPSAPPTQLAIFAFGTSGPVTNVKNLMNSSGVIAADATGVGTARSGIGATSYGFDKAIFAYGGSNLSNLVSNSGVVASDTSGVGSSRSAVTATTYGLIGQALFGYGSGGPTGVTNLVTSSGVVGSDVAAVGMTRDGPAACAFGSTGKAIVGYGYNAGNGGVQNVSNLISNEGVVASNTTGVGSARYGLMAASYGGDKGLFGYGTNNAGGPESMTNKVSNTGVVATDTSGVGTPRDTPGATNYGGDKAVFAFGFFNGSVYINVKNLVSNTGVVSADATGVGTARKALGAAGYSFST